MKVCSVRTGVFFFFRSEIKEMKKVSLVILFISEYRSDNQRKDKQYSGILLALAIA